MKPTLVLLLSLLAPPALAQPNGDVNVLVAGKRLVYQDWKPTDRHGELGLQTNWGRHEWPIHAALDFLVSGADRDIFNPGFSRQRASTTELDLGVRKIWRPSPRFRPYLGGGLAFISARLERTGPFGTISGYDDGAGLWLGGGVSWLLGKSLNLGLDAKLSGADVRILDERRAAGGFHLGVLVGWHWGG
jgi:hypothetical protein